MSTNYTISDAFNYDTVTASNSSFAGSTGTTGAGLLWRDTAANSNEVKVLLASGTVNQVLATTAASTIGWATAPSATDTTPFQVTRSAVQNISTGTATVVQWNSETIDAGANFDSTTNWWYTEPAAGYYYYFTVIEWDADGSNKSNKGSRTTRLATQAAMASPVAFATAKDQPSANKNIDFTQVLASLRDATGAQTNIVVEVEQDSGGTTDVGTNSIFGGWLVSSS